MLYLAPGSFVVQIFELRTISKDKDMEPIPKTYTVSTAWELVILVSQLSTEEASEQKIPRNGSHAPWSSPDGCAWWCLVDVF